MARAPRRIAAPKRAACAAAGSARVPEPGPLERAIALLRAFVDGQEHWGVRELAAATGEPTSTTHRLLARMRALGWLEFDEELKRYRVGFELLRVGAVLSHRHRIGQAAIPALESLASGLDESAWFFLHDAARARVACIAERSPARALRLPPPLGHEERLWSGPAGWAVLAALPAAEADAALRDADIDPIERQLLRERLPELNREGFCAGSSALLPEVIVIAAAVHDAAGAPRGSLCVAVPRVRFREEDARRFGIAVRDEARHLSYLLGATLLGGASAGSWHDAASAISALMRRQSPDLPMTPALGGGQSNLEDLQMGRAAYCLTTAVSLEDAFHGGSGAGTAHPRLASVMTLSALYLHVFTRPGIRLRTIADLAGLCVSPGAEGFSSARLFRELLEDSGIKPADAPRRGGAVLHLDYPEGQRLFRAGKVDVLFWLTGLNNAVCGDLARTPEVGMPSLPEAVLAKFVAHHPGYSLATMAAGGRSIHTLKVPTVIATVIDRPQDEVFRLAKVVHENRHELAVQGVLDGNADTIGPCPARVPIHPGARRYWEQGEPPPAPGRARRRPG